MNRKQAIQETLIECRELAESIEFDIFQPFHEQFIAVFPAEKNATPNEDQIYSVLKEMSLTHYYKGFIDIRNQSYVDIVSRIYDHLIQEINN